MASKTDNITFWVKHACAVQNEEDVDITHVHKTMSIETGPDLCSWEQLGSRIESEWNVPLHHQFFVIDSEAIDLQRPFFEVMTPDMDGPLNMMAVNTYAPDGTHVVYEDERQRKKCARLFRKVANWRQRGPDESSDDGTEADESFDGPLTDVRRQFRMRIKGKGVKRVLTTGPGMETWDDFEKFLCDEYRARMRVPPQYFATHTMFMGKRGEIWRTYLYPHITALVHEDRPPWGLIEFLQKLEREVGDKYPVFRIEPAMLPGGVTMTEF